MHRKEVLSHDHCELSGLSSLALLLGTSKQNLAAAS